MPRIYSRPSSAPWLPRTDMYRALTALNATKEIARLLASRSCQIALQVVSRPYVTQSGPAIIFAPHQDDETLGCGALIARKRNDGQPVHVVFLTDGSASHPLHPLLPQSVVAAIRLQESREVLSVLGVDSQAIHFFNEPDGTLDRISSARREMLVARIMAVLEKLQPTEIFLPCNGDGSSEHDAAFAFVIEAVNRSNVHSHIWEYPVWLWWNPRALLKRLALSSGRRRAPTEDFLALKRRALANYRSQLEPLPPQTEPALPRDLVRLIDTEAEYFFHFMPPATLVRTPLPPVI